MLPNHLPLRNPLWTRSSDWRFHASKASGTTRPLLHTLQRLEVPSKLSRQAEDHRVALRLALAPPCAVLVFGHAGKHANYKTWHRQGFLRLYYVLDAMFA